VSVVVETARPDEAAACARLLADVLGDDPVIRAMVPGDRDRTARLVALHVAQLRSGPLQAGSVDVARAEPGGPVLGVALWHGPGHGAPLGERLRQVPAVVRAVGLRHLSTYAAQGARYARHRPGRPHWYLEEIAVGPDARGLGVGSALLRHGLARVDAAGLPAYLEATTAASRRLYERFGFVATGPVPVRGPRPWAMLREPRTS